MQEILNMEPPRSIKEVQCLTRRMATLGWFVSLSMEKGLLFFETLRSVSNFKWTDEAEEAFEALKSYLASPPLLKSTKLRETLLLYLVATPVAVSASLVKEEDEHQCPIYYVRESLAGAR